MFERTARIAGPVTLTLFAVLGAVMGERPVLVGLGVAGAIAVLGVILAWERVSGWSLAGGLALAAAGLVVIGHPEAANLAWMGLCVCAGWIALTSTTPVAVTTGVLLVVTPVAEWITQTDEPGWAAWLTGTAFTLVVCLFARRLRVTVDQLRDAQHQLAERSRAEERSRIAAEVHDVIGHALTVSLLHLGSARLALDEDPDDARRALREAEQLTRDSLEEVRTSVGAMRDETGGERSPLPSAAAIPDLVESFRRVGAGVDLDVTGDLSSLGSARGLALYRIVQESLTNATRHAPGEPVRVGISITAAEARVDVRNDGPVAPVTSRGSGVRGMRERAEGVGGRLSAGALDAAARRGWLVEAVLPS